MDHKGEKGVDVALAVDLLLAAGGSTKRWSWSPGTGTSGGRWRPPKSWALG